MKISLKLFAALSKYLPPGAVRNEVPLDVSSTSSLNNLIDQCQIPRGQVHLVLVNGLAKNATERNSPILKEGDTVAMWPPVAGG